MPTLLSFHPLAPALEEAPVAVPFSPAPELIPVFDRPLRKSPRIPLRRFHFADESASMGVLIRSTFSTHGIDAQVHLDGTSLLRALDLAPEDRAPVVISDSLRDLSGTELVARLRALPGGADRWIILTVARSTLAARAELQRIDVDGVLARPYNHIDVLLAMSGVTDL